MITFYSLDERYPVQISVSADANCYAWATPTQKSDGWITCDNPIRIQSVKPDLTTIHVVVNGLTTVFWMRPVWHD